MADLDLSKVKVQERMVLRKFDGEWTDEQILRGDPVNAGALAEVMEFDGDILVNHWRRDG